MSSNPKEESFERILNSTVVNLRDLQSLSWHGIPTRHRAKCWQLLLGYLPVEACWRDSYVTEKRQEYQNTVRHEVTPYRRRSKASGRSDTFRTIQLDVPRTAPELTLFADERVQRCLGRILCVWAVKNPELGYAQGINDLVTPFFSVLLGDHLGGIHVTHLGESIQSVSDEILEEVEADTYWCLSIFLHSIQDHYTSDLTGMTRMVHRLHDCMKKVDPNLCRHLKTAGVDFMWFSFRWMNCFLLREFSLSCIIRMWDTYLSQEDLKFEDLHIYVCAGFLQEFSSTLRKMDYDDLFVFIQRMPTKDWGNDEVEMLLGQASLWSFMHQHEETAIAETDSMLVKPVTSHMGVMYDVDTLLFM